MPRTKKEETVEKEKKTTTKKTTTKKVVDNVSQAISEFDNYINLDFSKITKALIDDIKADETTREEKVIQVLKFTREVEDKCRGYYFSGNQFALPAINLHIARMNELVNVYEFLYTQTYLKNNQKLVLDRIVYVIKDILAPRNYEVLNSFGTTYEQFILNIEFSTVLVNKINYYINQLNQIGFVY